MAEVARGHGIPVEVGAFETWDDAGRRFDLITCGAAWHWIDPELGMAKAAHVLRASGTIARFWNYHVLDESVAAMFEAVYREHAPEAHPHGRALDDSGYIDPFGENEAFCSVETRTYRWERTLSADEWVGQALTFSDHQRLEPERLRTVARALHAAVETLGGTVEAHGGTYVVLARRA
ncbi:MAG: class I SAM-dependent methyltransferase, partial [Pseudonocardiaceae bacterium]